MNTEPNPLNSWAIKVLFALMLFGIAIAIVADRVTANRAAVKAKAEEAKAAEDAAAAESRAIARRTPLDPQETPTPPPSLPESAPVVALPEKIPAADLHLRWLLACSAMLFEANNEDHTVLAGMPLNDKNREDNRARLKKYWGITTTAELNQTIAELETRFRFDGCQAFAKKSKRISEADYEKALADKSNLDARFTLRLHDGPKDPNFLVAWDYCRAMNITRWGYAGGLLTEDQALAHLKRLGLKLQASYLSWYQMGMDYALAFEIWSESGSRRKIFFQLLTRPDSPWLTNQWLTVLPK